MWKKTILEHFSLDDIRQSLDEIAESGDYFGYEGDSMGEYYEEYRELFNELSMGAGDLQDAIDRIEEYDGEAWMGWDDLTVALLGNVKTVLGYDSSAMDYVGLLNPWEEKAGVQEAEKRLMRMNKQAMVHIFRQVLVVLTAYMDIKGSYDTLNAVVTELDDRAAAMKNGGYAARMWTE